MTDDELLNHLYHIKKNFGGTKQLYDKAKIQHPNITFKIVDKWLKDQAAYQINKEDLKKKQFLPIYSDIPNNFQIDLTFFRDIKKKIKEYMFYLLLLILIQDMLMLIIAKIKKQQLF